jgi:hypothetical protein
MTRSINVPQKLDHPEEIVGGSAGPDLTLSSKGISLELRTGDRR